MASLRPLEDRVVLKVLDAEEKTAGGILLPDSAQEKPQRGKITAVGEGKINKDGKRMKLDVKKGDVVLFGKYAGSDVKVDGQPIDLNKMYKVATNDFMITGGNGYETFVRGQNLRMVGFTMSNVLLDYLKTHQTVSPQVEGRITVRR